MRSRPSHADPTHDSAGVRVTTRHCCPRKIMPWNVTYGPGMMYNVSDPSKDPELYIQLTNDHQAKTWHIPILKQKPELVESLFVLMRNVASTLDHGN